MNSKSTSIIKEATMKNTDNFRYEGKSSRATTESIPFAVSKDEWDTKEDTGKSMKNALYEVCYKPIMATLDLLRNCQKWQFLAAKSCQV